MKKALICGISGQDGAYLAKLLLSKKYQVWGTSRDAQIANYANLYKLGIRDNVNMLSMAQSDFRSVLNTLSKSKPDEIYFLSGQSSVGLSFEQPAETMESIASGTLNLLEAVRFLDKPIRIYHASSSECFGEVDFGAPATEETPFQPRSPYGVAKASAHWLIANYREAYGLYCSNGILFNHESPLRPSRFVTRKIVSTACRIKSGSGERLTLGKLDISRDWGYAPDFVEAMWLMLQQEVAEDYVIATGQTHTLEEFVAEVFEQLGLTWKDHVETNPEFFRPSEILYSAGNSEKASKSLNWKPTISFKEMIGKLIESEQSVG